MKLLLIAAIAATICSLAYANDSLYVRFLKQSAQDIYLCEKHDNLLICDAYVPRTIISDSFNTTTYN